MWVQEVSHQPTMAHTPVEMGVHHRFLAAWLRLVVVAVMAVVLHLAA